MLDDCCNVDDGDFVLSSQQQQDPGVVAGIAIGAFVGAAILVGVPAAYIYVLRREARVRDALERARRARELEHANEQWLPSALASEGDGDGESGEEEGGEGGRSAEEGEDAGRSAAASPRVLRHAPSLAKHAARRRSAAGVWVPNALAVPAARSSSSSSSSSSSTTAAAESKSGADEGVPPPSLLPPQPPRLQPQRQAPTALALAAVSLLATPDEVLYVPALAPSLASSRAVARGTRSRREGAEGVAGGAGAVPAPATPTHSFHPPLLTLRELATISAAAEAGASDGAPALALRASGRGFTAERACACGRRGCADCERCGQVSAQASKQLAVVGGVFREIRVLSL
jgi:hypothetical protein